MKSIEQYVKQTYGIYLVALSIIAIASLFFYARNLWISNTARFEEKFRRVNSEVLNGRKNINNNLLVVEGVVREIVRKGNLDVAMAGRQMASAFNHNAAQNDIYFALAPEQIKKVRGFKKGLFFWVRRILPIEQYAVGTTFSMKKFKVESIDHDTYYTNPDEQWYQLPVKSPGAATYSGMYWDKTYTGQYLFSISRAIYDEQNVLLGVVGLDVKRSDLGRFFYNDIKDIGSLFLDKKNQTLLLENSIDGIKLSDYLLPKNTDALPLYRDSLFKNIDRSGVQIARLGERWVVYSVRSTDALPWIVIFYEPLWAFVQKILPFFIFLTVATSVFVFLILFLIINNQRKISDSFKSLLSQLKRDTLIVDREKKISEFYHHQGLLEVDELVDAINKFNSVLNENFLNYRAELDKNIKTNLELENLVKERTSQLLEHEKMASMGHMTAGFAHEIKNPLSLICGGSEVISRQMNKINTDSLPPAEVLNNILEKIKSSNEIILKNGHRVDNIIKTLLMQVRSDSKEKIGPLDIKEVIKTNLDFVLSSYRSRMNNRIEVNLDFSSEACMVNGNPSELGRMFINVLDNSCYAMSEKVKRDADFKGVLKIKVQKANSRVQITIRDNGTGIPEEVRKQVFTPFFTTKPAGEGTGLGMSFVYEIIQRYNGSIDISSKQNEFTEIKILFPAGE